MTRPSIFITGAAAGIGRATAQLFASRGWFVGLFDINQAGVTELRDQLGAANACAGRLDVTDVAAYQKALDQFWAAASKRLDVLFNNAGICTVGSFEDIPLTRHHAVTRVNLDGVINGFHLALPYLRQTPRACVISMCSASAIYGSPAFASYSASKFAVRGLSESLDLEWRRHGIAVRDLMPLFVDTPMVAQFETRPQSMDRLGVGLTANDIARSVWRAAHWPRWLPKVHFYPGLQTWFTALAQKLSPAWMNRWITGLLTSH